MIQLQKTPVFALFLRSKINKSTQIRNLIRNIPIEDRANLTIDSKELLPILKILASTNITLPQFDEIGKSHVSSLGIYGNHEEKTADDETMLPRKTPR